MNILYVSSLCSSTKFRNLFENATCKPAQQAQKYHRLMVEGLAKNEGISVTVLSSVPINRKISFQFYYKSEIEQVNGIEYRYLSFVNFPIVRQIFLFFTCFFSMLQLLKKNNKVFVICDVLNISVSCAAILATKITRAYNVGIVTDVPKFLARTTNNRITYKSKIVILINTFIINRFDSYVFLTRYMDELINKKHKSFVVIEGQVDIDMNNTMNDLSRKYQKKVCMYTGALKRIYGIKLLTDAFIAAGVDNSELHLYGGGEFKDELVEISQNCSNIKYFGIVSNDLVIKEQLKATLLVNPRPTNEEYTKYSFPSKNMEYMVSGTPTLASNLPGMPEEYKQYVYLIEEETVEGLTTILRSILSKPQQELYHKGMLARDFVLNNKNNVVQAGKVIRMIKEVKRNNETFSSTGKQLEI